ncbi:Sel1 repeat-containing protein [Nitrosomonas cryotolerans]|uniref:Sel1 repeat-containing protein n=1 Tax=Nitrosomonas cryotolerans ATCC 49181 TaxID=1131553 RepID=A0A1N6F629_9PROT|nr:Sel1 repeat-containing protein [Nitrosomonas cryotolerans]SIN90709.1 Sel1 repeat-containing protein [Nitrosomonas cryotolerans ATCC 49181]
MRQILHGSARTTAAVRRAIQDSQESLNVLAKRYAINPKTVAKWFRKVAELGQPFSQEALGTLYGRGDGVAQDFAEAMKWYRKAASQGNPKGQFYLGHLYLSGLGASKNLSEAGK